MRGARDTPVVHLELHTPDGPGAADVYAGLCGWRPEAVPTGTGAYLALDLGRRLGGGIVECHAARPLWLPYVQVAVNCEYSHREQRVGASDEVALLPPVSGGAV